MLRGDVVGDAGFEDATADPSCAMLQRVMLVGWHRRGCWGDAVGDAGIEHVGTPSMPACPTSIALCNIAQEGFVVVSSIPTSPTTTRKESQRRVDWDISPLLWDVDVKVGPS